MADQTIRIVGPSAGVTSPVIRVLAELTDTVIQDQVALKEANSSTYYATFTNVPAGRYRVELRSGTLSVASGIVSLSLTTGIFPEESMRLPETIDDLLSLNHSAGSWGAASGSGANLVTVTVTDGTNPLENAKIRLWEGVSDTGTVLTDVNGQVQFNLDDATYNVAITKPGYTFAAGQTVVVLGDTIVSDLVMTSISITLPSDPDKATGALLCLDQFGGIEPQAEVHCCITQGSGATGLGLNDSIWTVAADDDGYAIFGPTTDHPTRALIQGVHYKFWKGNNDKAASIVLIPAQASVDLNELIGH